MKSFYSISIPKPCHENWNAMTPNEKGRFCGSCAKTVIDFTQMTTSEIQNVFHENRNQRICGHIRQEQLNAINIQIPIESFSSDMNVQKLFLLVLLVVMGTTLFNCTNANNKLQKIDTVEVIDTILKSDPPVSKVLDSVKSETTKPPKPLKPIVVSPPISAFYGDIIMGIPIVQKHHPESPISFENVEFPPEFADTPANLSENEKRDYFKTKMKDFVLHNFNIETTINLGLSGTQKIICKFTINERGILENIQIKSPHPLFEKEAIRVFKLLPPLIPAKQGDENLSVTYNLPILFKIEE